MSSTIVAIATATAVSSISIVRVSGDRALDIAKKIVKSNNIVQRYAHLFSIYNREGILIDQAVVIYFKAPKSFTGEDIIEFQCHGGAVIANEIVESVIYYGARLAQAGEFTKRAFLNGKIDLTKAEAISKLIEAKSVDGAKILARQLKGELKDFIDATRDKLLKAISYAEVMIDYADEDIPKDIIDNLLKQLNLIESELIQIVDASNRRRGIIYGFRVAIIGKPNVGKSSLLNSLLNYDRAIVSNIAGTTRDTIEEDIRIGTHVIRLIDTAGIRDSVSDEIEKIGIERSISSVKDADIIIAIFDNASSLTEDDIKILNILNKNMDKNIIVAINKIDLNRKIDVAKLSNFDYIEISIKDNFKPLIKRLNDILDNISGGEELILVSHRQIEAVLNAKNSILDAKLPLINEELEIFSYHLQDAVKYLSSISKPFNSEEILDKMFSEFCLGK